VEKAVVGFMAQKIKLRNRSCSKNWAKVILRSWWDSVAKYSVLNKAIYVPEFLRRSEDMQDIGSQMTA
jgi:hypothetical protein